MGSHLNVLLFVNARPPPWLPSIVYISLASTCIKVILTELQMSTPELFWYSLRHCGSVSLC